MERNKPKQAWTVWIFAAIPTIYVEPTKIDKKKGSSRKAISIQVDEQHIEQTDSIDNFEPIQHAEVH